MHLEILNEHLGPRYPITKISATFLYILSSLWGKHTKYSYERFLGNLTRQAQLREISCQSVRGTTPLKTVLNFGDQ